MLTQDYTAKLLDLEDVMIKNVEHTSDKIFIQIELPRKTHICPACGSRTDRVHDYRRQIIKDVPLGRDTFLILRKRRYICACGKHFPEKNSFLPRYIEGCNNKTKVLKRTCYGMRNFNNLRKRILFCNT